MNNGIFYTCQQNWGATFRKKAYTVSLDKFLTQYKLHHHSFSLLQKGGGDLNLKCRKKSLEVQEVDTQMQLNLDTTRNCREWTDPFKNYFWMWTMCQQNWGDTFRKKQISTVTSLVLRQHYYFFSTLRFVHKFYVYSIRVIALNSYQNSFFDRSEMKKFWTL